MGEGDCWEIPSNVVGRLALIGPSLHDAREMMIGGPSGLMAEGRCAVTRATTAENADHLSPGFVADLEALYGGTRRAAQELEGRVVEIEGALFPSGLLAAARTEEGGRPWGSMQRWSGR